MANDFYVQVARSLYPKNSWDDQDSDSIFVCSYEPIIKYLGKSVVEVRDDDYQGDTRVLLFDANKNRYGFLVFGWGSCSGCDALQACENYSDIAELIEGFEKKVRWFDSLQAAKDFICDNAKQELEFHYHATEWRIFTLGVAGYQPTN